MASTYIFVLLILLHGPSKGSLSLCQCFNGRQKISKNYLLDGRISQSLPCLEVTLEVFLNITYFLTRDCASPGHFIQTVKLWVTQSD